MVSYGYRQFHRSFSFPSSLFWHPSPPISCCTMVLLRPPYAGAILVGFSGGFAPCPIPALAGRHDEETLYPCREAGLDHGGGPPRLPLDHATALQHRRQGVCEDADVMLRGHKWPRRSARPMISSRGSHRRGALQWYMLQASFTSAGPPILYGRFRPISGELPKGTYRGSAIHVMLATRFLCYC